MALLLFVGMSACGEEKKRPHRRDDEPVEYTMEDYQGYWEYSDGNVLYVADYDWYLYSNVGELLLSGNVDCDEEGAYFSDINGESCTELHFNEAGDLLDFDQTLIRLAEFPFGNTEENGLNALLEGEWLHSDMEDTIVFDGEGSYTWVTEFGVVVGTYQFDGESLTLFNDEGGFSNARLNEYGQLIVEGNVGSYFYKAEDSVG